MKTAKEIIKLMIGEMPFFFYPKIYNYMIEAIELGQKEAWNEAIEQETILLPSIDDAGIIAVNIVKNVVPRLSAQEEALFIAGFQECVKYLSMQKLKK